MSWDYTDADLERIANLDPAECPPGEEGEWLYLFENALLEARHRDKTALLAKLAERLSRMRTVATRRGYRPRPERTSAAATTRRTAKRLEQDPHLEAAAAAIGMRHIKARLLAKYATRAPRGFVQVDGFANSPEDDVIRADADGDLVLATSTVELMHGATVRVLVDPGAQPDAAARLLRKAADMVARGVRFETPRLPDDRGLVNAAMQLVEAAEQPQAVHEIPF